MEEKANLWKVVVVVVPTWEKGTFLLKAIADETTRGIAKLVARQEESVKSRKNDAVKAPAPAIEMPPLEPIRDAKWFHLPAEEKSEPVEGQALDMGDVLKQCQDLDLKLSIFNLATTPEIPPDAVQDRSLCGFPPLERLCLVGVFVECIISPSRFYIQACHAETSDKLQDMMFEMRGGRAMLILHCYLSKLVSDRSVMPESSVRPGQLCCVTVSKWWYRVIIHRVINDQEAEVFYADYGNLGIVRRFWVFLRCRRCYLKLPAEAIPCSLAWVKPVGGSRSNDAILLFKKLCDSKLLVGVVDEYVNGICHLFLCDAATKDDIYFHAVLSSRGCADICGKKVPSQGFEEVNPSALYLEPSRKQENAEPVEPHLRLQQESLNVNSDIASSKLDEDELWEQVRWHLSAEEELEGDVWPALDEASVQSTTDRDPEPAQEDTKESPPELITEAKHGLWPALSFGFSREPASLRVCRVTEGVIELEMGVCLQGFG
ncbi:tudor domain-containing protein 5-like [Phaenicophaeus curvirostris]|uniref:tudor domain-containing protein 5-like n=1 Tax=Phaenicophaeus curvirostris TaxID=33595 RepID=UPI0037F0EE5C